jgi:hypothetical protein
MEMANLFSTPVVHQLQYYVYIYIDPLVNEVFYVGKGRSNRAFSHLNDPGPSAKTTRIAEIRKEGHEPKIEILVHGLSDEETAYKIEAAVIDLIGPDNLTNEVKGYHSSKHGRMNLAQIQALYAAEPVKIQEPSLLIRINKLYRHTMTELELYDATRIAWKLGQDREKVKYAMAVYASVIREVYEVMGWFPEGSTFQTIPNRNPPEAGRWEFVGKLADIKIRKKYQYRSVAHYFQKASQNPIQYVNVD